MLVLETTLPIKTVSEANMREHWAVKHKRHKAQRYEAALYCRKEFGLSPLKFGEKKRIFVELTRLATRRLDRDNGYGSIKSVVDGICDWLGHAGNINNGNNGKSFVNDGDKLFTLSYSQEFKSKSNELKLKLTIGD